MDSTDYLRLNQLKIFKTIRESLPENIGKTTNLLTQKDNVLYGWDYENGCVLSLNLKVLRSLDGDNITHQCLLPLLPVTFKPETLLVNDSGTLLIVSGPSGVLVMELPARYPPYGAFDHNKELVYCRSHRLDERLFLCNDSVEVRRVRFHPSTTEDNTIIVLTSDNKLRWYSIENSEAINVRDIQIGQKPCGLFPSTKRSMLSAFGEIGVDFDFGQPETRDHIGQRNTGKTQDFDKDKKILVWPIYILFGNGNIYALYDKVTLPFTFKPIISNSTFGCPQDGEACSILCLNTNPEIICIANSNGTIYHTMVLSKFDTYNPHPVPIELICFESIEIELGLPTLDPTDLDDSKIENQYKCPIFLHKDESKVSRYFATHPSGVHSITITSYKDLHTFITGPDDQNQAVLEDIFNQESKAEYLLCTKTIKSDKANHVIGFCLYYDPPAIITLLNDGSVVSLQILTISVLSKLADLTLNDSEFGHKTDSTPLKKMLTVPFDQYIENILKKNPSNQPIIKLGINSNHTQKEAYEILQHASQIFREYYFETNNKARDEIEKRIKTLQMMKEYQLKELERMSKEKALLQETAENLAEKYEDIKDKQDTILKRCERLLILVSQKKSEPSDAEKDFEKEIGDYQEKTKKYAKDIEKLKMKVKYAQMKIDQWKDGEAKQVHNTAKSLSETHTTTIKNNLKEMSEKITSMVNDINDYKQKLNLK